MFVLNELSLLHTTFRPRQTQDQSGLFLARRVFLPGHRYIVPPSCLRAHQKPPPAQPAGDAALVAHERESGGVVGHGSGPGPGLVPGPNGNSLSSTPSSPEASGSVIDLRTAMRARSAMIEFARSLNALLQLRGLTLGKW